MSAGDTYTDLGTKLYIASGKPASFDQTGVAALSFTEIGGVVSLPQRGDSVEDISEPTLSDGRSEHFGGLKDGGVLEIPIKYIESDAGQAMIPENGSNDTFTLQEVDIDGTAHFYYGRVMSFQRRESTTSSNKGFILMFGVNSERLSGTPVVS